MKLKRLFSLFWYLLPILPEASLGSVKASGREPKSCLGSVFNFKLCCFVMCTMRLCQPPDGTTSPKYKLLCFITTKSFCKEKNALAFNRDRCFHLVLCLRLIPFHCMAYTSMADPRVENLAQVLFCSLKFVHGYFISWLLIISVATSFYY